MPLVEHAAMTLAAHAGIHAALIAICVPLAAGPRRTVRRFDRVGGCAATHFRPTWRSRPRARRAGYPELAQWAAPARR